MPFIGIKVGSIRTVQPGILGITYRHRDYGSGWIFLRESNLQPVDRKLVVPPAYPSELLRPTIAFRGIHVKLAIDLGASADSSTKYVLRWETLGANHDRPRRPPLPPVSMLKLVKLSRAD